MHLVLLREWKFRFYLLFLVRQLSWAWVLLTGRHLGWGFEHSGALSILGLPSLKGVRVLHFQSHAEKEHGRVTYNLSLKVVNLTSTYSPVSELSHMLHLLTGRAGKCSLAKLPDGGDQGTDELHQLHHKEEGAYHKQMLWLCLIESSCSLFLRWVVGSFWYGKVLCARVLRESSVFKHKKISTDSYRMRLC